MIKVKWNIPIHTCIEEIDIEPVSLSNSYSYSHVPYRCIIPKSPITYTFHSFYSKGFIVFVMDSYHSITQTHYEHKYMICIPIRYKENERHQYELDIVSHKPIRSYLVHNRKSYCKQSYSMKDWLVISKHEPLTVYFIEKEKKLEEKIYEMVHPIGRAVYNTSYNTSIEKWDQIYYILILFMILKNIEL